METTTAAAHIITADAEGLGDPAVLVMTPDEGFGATVIESFHLTSDATRESAMSWIAGGLSGWTRCVGSEPVEVATGYYVVDVERI